MYALTLSCATIPHVGFPFDLGIVKILAKLIRLLFYLTPLVSIILLLFICMLSMTKQTDNKTDLRKYSNAWYDPQARLLKRIVWYLINSIFFINPLNASSSLKILLLRIFGAKVGKGVTIKPAVNIKYPWLLEVGNYVWIGEKVWIDNLSKTTIHDHVVLSQGAMLLTGSHNYKSASFDLMIGEIILEEGVWIGAQAVVCPGIRCGSHSVLSVYSVATSNLKPYTIYQGNPAVEKRTRSIT
jgi:putative colanic acid biosynthesis acetyltransferase WcaF